MDKLNQYNSERLDNIDVEKQELKKNDDSKYWEYQIQRINEEIIENKTELTTVETVKDKKKIAERITYLQQDKDEQETVLEATKIAVKVKETLLYREERIIGESFITNQQGLMLRRWNKIKRNAKKLLIYDLGIKLTGFYLLPGIIGFILPYLFNADDKLAFRIAFFLSILAWLLIEVRCLSDSLKERESEQLRENYLYWFNEIYTERLLLELDPAVFLSDISRN